MVAEMTDVFVLLIAPGGGDELQGVKRGIMEMADILLVNKADGALEAAATRTRADYAGALRLLRPRPGDPPGWPKAMTVSALTGAGIDEAWQAVEALAAARRASGAWEARRRTQAEAWFGHAIEDGLVARMTADPAVARRRQALAAEVAAGTIPPMSRPRCCSTLCLEGNERMGRFFENELHDEFAGWLLGYTATGGPDVGVLAAVAAAVGKGGDDAFHTAWIAAGDRLLAEAGATSHQASRCRLTLWASACYATSYHPLYGAPVDPRLTAAFRKQIAAFDAGPRPAAGSGRNRCASRSRARRFPPTSCPRKAMRRAAPAPHLHQRLRRDRDRDLLRLRRSGVPRAVSTACSSTAPARARC